MGNIFAGLSGLLGGFMAAPNFGAIEAQSQTAALGSGSGFTGTNLSWGSDLANATFTIDAPYGLPNSGVTSVARGIPPPTEETALAWLDRRVSEMRVAL